LLHALAYFSTLVTAFQPPALQLHPSPLARLSTSLASAGGAAAQQSVDGVRIGPPPDLPSLLLNNRIVYIGMPLVPAVTELVVAELLYLNYESPEKPVYMYINSPGTVAADGRSVGFETEAFAIADCMNYIKPPVQTICLGQAYGAAAMLLANGEKGSRFCLPNSSIMLHQPRSMARGQASDIAIKAREVLANRQVTNEMLAEACGKSVAEVEKDVEEDVEEVEEEVEGKGTFPWFLVVLVCLCLCSTRKSCSCLLLPSCQTLLGHPHLFLHCL